MFKLVKYISAQDEWIRKGYIKIMGIEGSRKDLSKGFLEAGKMDLNAYKLLKDNNLSQMAIFHLQQAAEKIAKALLILDMNDVKYKDLKDHNFIYVLERLIKKHDGEINKLGNLENAIFRQAITTASQKILDFLKLDNLENVEIYGKYIKKYIELRNEIINLKEKYDTATNNEEKIKLKNEIDKKEIDILDSGLFTCILKENKGNNKALKKLKFASSDQIESLISINDNIFLSVFSEESKNILLPFYTILFITLVTYPHETITRYPDTNGLIQDYSRIGIFQSSDTIYQKLNEIIVNVHNKLKLV